MNIAIVSTNKIAVRNIKVAIPLGNEDMGSNRTGNQNTVTEVVVGDSLILLIIIMVSAFSSITSATPAIWECPYADLLCLQERLTNLYWLYILLSCHFWRRPFFC